MSLWPQVLSWDLTTLPAEFRQGCGLAKEPSHRPNAEETAEALRVPKLWAAQSARFRNCEYRRRCRIPRQCSDGSRRRRLSLLAADVNAAQDCYSRRREALSEPPAAASAYPWRENVTHASRTESAIDPIRAQTGWQHARYCTGYLAAVSNYELQLRSESRDYPTGCNWRLQKRACLISSHRFQPSMCSCPVSPQQKPLLQ